MELKTNIFGKLKSSIARYSKYLLSRFDPLLYVKLLILLSKYESIR